jgi:TonB family protein
MIKRENHDYQIAILGSLVFHLVLFMIYFPNASLRQDMNLKTYPVGMVTLSKGPAGLADETPVIDTKVNEKDPPRPVTKPENPPVRQEPVKKVPDPPRTNLPPRVPVENSIATSDGPNSTEKPVTPVPAVNSGGNMAGPGEGAEPGGSGSGAPPEPRGLGNGEGKVFQMGALPPYPKNALNEGIQGTVGLRILVFENGGLEKIDLMSSSGDPRLDNAALRTVKNWRFQPESEAYYIDIVFAFDLKNGVSVKFIKAETRP